MKRLLLSVTALLMAQSGLARESIKVGDWTIDAVGETCSATALYGENRTDALTHVSIHYNARNKTAYIAFTNSKATSLKQDEQVYLTIAFKRPNGDYDEGWGAKRFDVTVMSSGTRYFESQNLDYELVSDFARSKLVVFFIGTEAISAFPLDGSAVAVTALKECAFEAAGLNPLDPFLK